MLKYEDFSGLADAYERGRKPYPQEIISHCLSRVPSGHRVLDLGCGTGIATRQQSASGASIIGCDPSFSMLQKAARHPVSPVHCVLGAAEKLPFADSAFALVTAFTSFHWFPNDQAIGEIKRVLGPYGIFCAVNKSNFGREILEDATGRKFLNHKQDYFPLKLLLHGGFRVECRVFQASEHYSLSEFLSYMQSIIYWNFVPPREKLETLRRLRTIFESRARDDVFQREADYIMFIGRK